MAKRRGPKQVPELYVNECPACSWRSWPAKDRETSLGEFIEHYKEDHDGSVVVVGLND